jgi:hypothetical protein
MPALTKKTPNNHIKHDVLPAAGTTGRMRGVETERPLGVGCTLAAIALHQPVRAAGDESCPQDCFVDATGDYGLRQGVRWVRR